MKTTTLVFDVETRLTAAEVSRLHAGVLAGASPWSRPDLFGFACGVAEDVSSGEALRYAPDEARRLIQDLSCAKTVSYNGAAFDLGVLSAYGDVSGIRARHVDLRAVVAEKLAQLGGGERLRSGGLDALARANGIGGKTGSGASAPELYREGRIEELLAYCESDVRITARLYEMARTEKLRVEPYVQRDGQRVSLPAVDLDLRAALALEEAGR